MKIKANFYIVTVANWSTTPYVDAGIENVLCVGTDKAKVAKDAVKREYDIETIKGMDIINVQRFRNFLVTVNDNESVVDAITRTINEQGIEIAYTEICDE